MHEPPHVVVASGLAFGPDPFDHEQFIVGGRHQGATCCPAGRFDVAEVKGLSGGEDAEVADEGTRVGA